MVRALIGRSLTRPAATPKPEIVKALESVGLNADASHYEATLNAKGLEGLSDDNGLSVDQNRQLFSAQSLSEVIGWVLYGLSKVKQ